MERAKAESSNVDPILANNMKTITVTLNCLNGTYFVCNGTYIFKLNNTVFGYSMT